jgi:hypothetical protein
MIGSSTLQEVSSSLSGNLSRVGLAVVLVMVVGLASCAKDRETVRTRSPDGKVDALLVERETGATVATPVLLYIVKAGDPAGSGEPVLLGDNFDGLSIKWAAPKLLSVTHKKGRIFKFTNFWESRAVDDWSYVVEVRLNPTNLRSLG